MAAAIAAVREAFALADRGGAVMPASSAHLPDVDGELHVKGAYLKGAPVFAVKTATGFYRNAGLGLPVSGGMTMVHDATTGRLQVLIADGGLLTELRTAAAGALAADLLARPGARAAAVIGTGRPGPLPAAGAAGGARHRAGDGLGGAAAEAAEQFRRDMAAAGVPVSVAATARAAVEAAEVVITATTSTEPLIRAPWPARGAHVTAVGSDMPHKQELDPQILAAAAKYVPDSIEAAAASGELHHAIEAGVFDAGSVYGELAAVASGRLVARTADDELTVADLTGLGIQDVAVGRPRHRPGWPASRMLAATWRWENRDCGQLPWSARG